MVIFFSEQDMVSFGNFVQSDLRFDLYKQNLPNVKESDIKIMLKTVSVQDLSLWMQVMDQSSQEEVSESDAPESDTTNPDFWNPEE